VKLYTNIIHILAGNYFYNDAIFSGNKPCQLRTKAQRFGEHLRLRHQGNIHLMMEAEMFSETLGFYPQLTRLVAREDVIEFSRRATFKSVIFIISVEGAGFTAFRTECNTLSPGWSHGPGRSSAAHLVKMEERKIV
jgi:hypothetical protein